MAHSNDAVLSIAKALQNPNLDDAAREALVTALQAITSTPTKASASKSPKVRTTKGSSNRVTLTKTGIAAMPYVESGESLVFDEVVPQLAVRVRLTKKSYVVLLWDKERRKKITRTLGDVSLYTPEQARQQAKELIGAAVKGLDIRKSDVRTLSLSELVEHWHKSKNKTVRTADEIRSQVLRYSCSLINRDADKITREDIGRIHRYIATEARKIIYKKVGDEIVETPTGEAGLPATADKFVAYVRTIYQWGNENALCATNPAKGLKGAYDTKRSKRTRYLHGDELLRFWAALEVDQDADCRDALKLLLYTGQRRGNVLEMRWQDIDLTSGVWTVGADKTKQSEVQSTPLVGQALEILSRRYQVAGTQWVFPATRMSDDGEIGCMSEARLRDAWLRILAAAEIEDLRIHDLRHTSGSWLARLGVSEAIRQKALGHKTPAMAARYSHLELDPVSDAMQRAANAIEAHATNKSAEVRSFKRRAKNG